MKPKDRDMIETRDGMFFVVVGYLHPPGKVTAYLKYIPTSEGKWSRGDTHYTRTFQYYHVTQIENTYSFLSEKHPDYIFDCPVRDITISCVPLNDVKRYYSPVDRIASLVREGPSDPLEEKLIGLVEYLVEQTRVEGRIGVTGSLLTCTHNPMYSDIDITVYGREESQLVKDAILGAKEEGVIRGLNKEEIESWIAQRAEKFPLSSEELRRIASRRWNFGFYKDTYFSIHSIRKDREIIESYGDIIYTNLGEVQGTAVVIEAAESIYLPAIYKVMDSDLEKSGIRISEIVSYEGFYGGLFEKGEKVEFRGILERYKGKKEGHRVVLGGSGSKDSYVKWA